MRGGPCLVYCTLSLAGGGWKERERENTRTATAICPLLVTRRNTVDT